MRRTGQIVQVFFISVLLGACANPQPPPADVLSRGMIEALLDTGFYSEVNVSQVIGQHYSDADNRWTIYACFQFILADATQGETCVDSFSALQLDNRSWIIAVTINEVYRWRAISLTPGPASNAGGNPGE